MPMKFLELLFYPSLETNFLSNFSFFFVKNTFFKKKQKNISESVCSSQKIVFFF